MGLPKGESLYMYHSACSMSDTQIANSQQLTANELHTWGISSINLIPVCCLEVKL